MIKHCLIWGLWIILVLPLGANASLQDLKQTSQSFRLAAEKGIPAVVSIQTLHEAAAPITPFFGQGGQRSYAKRFQEGGFGSGVIVAENGLILTNYHVIRRGEQIVVTLSDQRTFTANLVGADPNTDLAVLQIDATDLPVIQVGDSDKIEVGDWAIAVGNPFGLQGTVTTGIISAKGRAKSKIADYAALIQTDAAINPGNSGGALLNLSGELVGINTAIFSQTGGYMGIGFAIPSNLAMKVVQDIQLTGHVSRGWLGLFIQPITPDIQSQFKLETPAGVLVSDIVPNSPAEQAGLQRGDVIQLLDGLEITNEHSLRAAVAKTPLGTGVEIQLIRDQTSLTLNATISASPDEIARAEKPYLDRLGLDVANRPKKQSDYGHYRSETGLIIKEVLERSPAYRAGLKVDDLILEITHQKIRNKKHYQQRIEALRPGDELMLLVRSGKFSRYVVITL